MRLCLVPGGKLIHTWRHKRWPYYEELVRALLKEYADAQICILGAGGDSFPGELPRSGQVVDLRGRLSLRETAWVFAQARLAIGNDCGPMHIADAVQTPSLVMFGPTCDLKSGPMYRGVSLHADVACSPCQYDRATLDTCAEPRCMTDLSVGLVLRQIARLLRGPCKSRQRPSDSRSTRTPTAR